MFRKDSYSIIKFFFILSVGFGIVMGLIFPLFSSFFVDYKSENFLLLFRIICVVAGIFVGLTSFLIARLTIIKVIHQICGEMNNLVNDEIKPVNKIKFKSNDIIGKLVSRFNLLIDKLNSVIDNIKKMVKDSIILSENLSHNSTRTSERITGISNEINHIKEEYDKLNKNIKNSFIVIDKFNNYIKSFILKVEEQTNLVEEGFILIEKNLETINLLSEDSFISNYTFANFTLSENRTLKGAVLRQGYNF